MSYSAGELVNRPWGVWEVLVKGENYAVKRVTIDPGKRLSLQFHHHRLELWTIVAGQGEVELDGARLTADLGDQFRIPKLARHRIANTGSLPLVLIEVQFGSRLDEGDIVRLMDDFGRVPATAE
ncbi:MAG: mannose-6-phosphate isomerase [Phenylobacterium sp.]|uniref:phosphomannose isomerase type II C-terminal cupin domain n=1 Tax=Phenylobacterium sp. TaxID=1871053 RepID=UPI0025D108BA|nr:phosphomannose isomerase type II C-terminal cupin domain [Phenylobacterium sp.]MBA4010694.1 mannose-6-phosphate isomerase [Phenylobacterium sp.]